MLPLLQEGPAQTVNYFVAGYVVIFGVMALYLVSLIVRKRNLRRTWMTMKEVQEREE